MNLDATELAGIFLPQIPAILLLLVWGAREFNEFRASKRIEDQHRAALDAKDAQLGSKQERIDFLQTELESLERRTPKELIENAEAMTKYIGEVARLFRQVKSRSASTRND
jgi:hypothetical protein